LKEKGKVLVHEKYTREINTLKASTIEDLVEEFLFEMFMMFFPLVWISLKCIDQ
jgi:hypothetical protein